MITRQSVLCFAAVCTLIPGLGVSSDLGITGLIDTPTARMRADGEFAASISKQPLVDIYSLNYQATPWLETTFRYAAFTEYGHYDRSYEAKLKLLSESEKFPEIAIGIRDLLGTGNFGTEYVVFSKAYGALDVSLGIGWGRFADGGRFRNPLTYISSGFEEREADLGLEDTGQLRTSSLFSGEKVGIFGGVSYAIPGSDLRLLAEYNPDQYRFEQERGGFDASEISEFSFGAEWEALPGVVLAGSHQFGKEWAFRIESKINSAYLPEPYPVPYFVSSLDSHNQNEAVGENRFNNWYSSLHYDMSQSGLALREASRNTGRTEVSIVVSNLDFAITSDAVNHALTLSELHLPLSYRVVNLVINKGDMQPITIRYQRQRTPDNGWAIGSSNSIELLAGREIDPSDLKTNFQNGHLGFTADLGTRFQIMDPHNPLRHQVFLRLGLTSSLGRGWRLRSSYVLNIDNNFDEITRSSDSVLPHVRSDVDRYLKEGASGLGHFYLNRQDNLSGDVFYRLYGGVLEEMYSGVGAEILYQPFRSRLAYGFSANWVKQRGYDKSFSHLDYDTVTAFASVYWATPWYNYDVAIHMGRFLAKDVGSKFEIRRTFDNGWSIGAWATLTDVPFEEFGEGSFDKGIRIQVPLHSLSGSNSRSSYRTAIRSIQRDGGQMLENFTGLLWYELRETRYDMFDRTRARMIPR
jgi:hypothetical protein